MGQALSNIVLGTIHRLTTRLNFSRLDVAGAQSDFELSVCLGILEFSELGHRQMVVLKAHLLCCLLGLFVTSNSTTCPDVGG